MNQKIKSVWHCKFQSSNMVQLEQNKDIAYNAFLGQLSSLNKIWLFYSKLCQAFGLSVGDRRAT